MTIKSQVNIDKNEEFSKKHRVEKFIDWYKIGAIIKKNLIVIMRDKTRLVPLLAFPIIMMLVLGYTTGNTPKHIPAAIVLNDNSELALSLTQMISGSQYFAVRYVVSNQDEARKLLDSSKIMVVINIPANLQKSVDTGKQGVISVIVDESDSSVAATSKQVLRNIISEIGRETSNKKIVNFQKSIDNAANSMAKFGASFPNSYFYLSQQVEGDKEILSTAQSIISLEKELLISTPIIPPRVNIPAKTIITYNNTEYLIENETGFLLESTPTTRSQIQAAALDSAEKMVGKTQDNLESSKGTIESDGETTSKLINTDYDKQISESLIAIQLFTKSDSRNLLMPLVYEEKPAYGTGRNITDFVIPSLIAMTIFQGAIMGMGRAVAGEKREGSLTRVFLTPTSNITIIVGTLLFYVLFEILRAAFLIVVAIIMFDLKIQGSILLIGLTLAIFITISTSVGMVISSMVRTEQQFMALAMLVSLPTMFLGGVFFPIQAMPMAFQAIAKFLPITYAADALRTVMVKGLSFASIIYPLSILMIFLILVFSGVLVFFKRDIE